MLLTPDAADNGGLFAALLAFRCIYYILPLLLAALTLAVHEALKPSRSCASWPTPTCGATLVPQALAALTFASGAVLLLSGATPSLAGRLLWLKDHLPGSVVGGSHLMGSVIGMCLLFPGPRHPAPPGRGLPPDGGHVGSRDAGRTAARRRLRGRRSSSASP